MADSKGGLPPPARKSFLELTFILWYLINNVLSKVQFPNEPRELKRFLKVYPAHKDLEYVYYLLAICYYEQIVDEKKDTQSIINAKKEITQITIENEKLNQKNTVNEQSKKIEKEENLEIKKN